MGSPTDGHLTGGMHLEESAYLRIVPADSEGDVRWGLEPLVNLIEHAARALRHEFPDSVTSIGDLSREGGGEVERHRSHESGRDADIAFFVRSLGGRQLLPSHFVRFRADGTASTWPGAYFDDAKNWALVTALVSDDSAHVTHIFIATPLRSRLLAYAERSGASLPVRVRAAELMRQPRATLPHDDHFHIRIACPDHMTGCIENPVAHARPLPRHHDAVPAGPRGPASGGMAAAPSRPRLARPPSTAGLSEDSSSTVGDHPELPPPAVMAEPAEELDE